MKKVLTHLLVMACILTGASSCMRRPFSQRTTGVRLQLNINTGIINADNIKKPETMMVEMYDSKTRKLAYTDFVGPDGGTIYPSAGIYDILIYNLGTQKTQIRGEDSFSRAEAFTDELDPYIKGQLSKLLSFKKKNEQYYAAPKADNATTDGPKADPQEKIVYQPDYLFVGRISGYEVPLLREDESQREIVIEMDAESVVETWKIELVNVTGIQWISSINAIISGQVGSRFLSTGEKSGEVVSVYFPMSSKKYQDKEAGIISGKFDTFGKYPGTAGGLSIDVGITDTAGEDHYFHYDVTDKFPDNPGRHIIIEEKVVIDEPKVPSGGGFLPSVDDWENVDKDIIL